jgi:4-carboxymuconolactone decarboxylase
MTASADDETGEKPGGVDEGNRRSRGMAKMQEVYGFSVDPADVPGDYAAVTVDHLFGTIWTRPALGIRDRRLLTIGTLAALGQTDLLEIQFSSALERAELDEEEVRELVLHLTHYVGWPLSTGMNAAAERVIAQRQQTGRSTSGGEGQGETT